MDKAEDWHLKLMNCFPGVKVLGIIVKNGFSNDTLLDSATNNYVIENLSNLLVIVEK